MRAEHAYAFAQQKRTELAQSKPANGISKNDLMELGITAAAAIVPSVKDQLDAGSEKAVYKGRKVILEFPQGALVKYYNKGQEAYCFVDGHGEKIIRDYVAAGSKINWEAWDRLIAKNGSAFTPGEHHSLSDILDEAKKFIETERDKNIRDASGGKHFKTLFCAFLYPAAEGIQLVLHTYRYGEMPNDPNTFTIYRPPQQHMIPVGDSLAYGTAVLIAVEDAILGIPGVEMYKKLQNPRNQIVGDQIIPKEPAPNNGNGHMVQRKGTYQWLLDYGGEDQEIVINLGPLDIPENREEAERRAQALVEHIQFMHNSDALVTRNGMAEWIRDTFGVDSPQLPAPEPYRTLSINFPRPDAARGIPEGATTLVISPRFLDGTPARMLKITVRLEYLGKPIGSELTIPLHILDEHLLPGVPQATHPAQESGEPDISEERLELIAHRIKRYLEMLAEAGGNYSLHEERLVKVNDHHDSPVVPGPYDVDARRWEDMRNLAASFEIDHYVREARPRLIVPDEQGSSTHLSCALTLCRTNGFTDNVLSRSPRTLYRRPRPSEMAFTNEIFQERLAAGNPPVDLVRNFYVTIGGTGSQADIDAAYRRADAYITQVQGIVYDYLRPAYGNTNHIEPQQRRPESFNPDSFRNLLNSAMRDASRNFGFPDVQPDDRPPHTRIPRMHRGGGSSL